MRRTLSALFVCLLLATGVAFGDAENWISNGRHGIKGHGDPLTVQVPTGGRWFPEAVRVAPGAGAGVAARIYPMPGGLGDSSYGNALYLRWNQGQYHPWVEPGQGFLHRHVFEYDALIGQTVALSWTQRVDGCCVNVVPMVMVNYHNGDYEFWGGGGHFLLEDEDAVIVNGKRVWTAQAKAEYKARVLAAPYCVATEAWEECTILFPLPDGSGHVIDNNRHFNVTFTFRNPTAPGIHLANVRLRRL